MKSLVVVNFKTISGGMMVLLTTWIDSFETGIDLET